MSKVICDVCGTTYAETAAQCPLCGCARKSVAQTGADSSGEGSSYAYVRGGRFSKSNVRKRNHTGKDFERRSVAAAPVEKTKKETAPAKRTTAEKREDNGGMVNKGLIALVIILLLAIVAVTAYICVKTLLPSGNENPPDRPGTSTAAPSTVPDPTQSAPAGIPCTGLTLSGSTIEFSEAENGWLLNVAKEPADTTETVTFTSSDENVATVTEGGYITAIGGGQAVITVTCGNVSAECTVVCSFGETTKPTEPVDTDFLFEFNTRFIDESTGKYDTTIDAAGKTWRAYKTGMTVAPEDIQWTVDDPSICTIDDGIVTAIAPGKTEVHATYNGKTYNCIVRCSWEVEEETQPTEPVDTDFLFEFNTRFIDESTGKYDTTIDAAGKTWRAYKTGMTVAPEDIQWTVDDPSICTIDDGIVTAIAPGKTEVHATYGGATYTCIVRVTE